MTFKVLGVSASMNESSFSATRFKIALEKIKEDGQKYNY